LPGISNLFELNEEPRPENIISQKARRNAAQKITLRVHPLNRHLGLVNYITENAQTDRQKNE